MSAYEAWLDTSQLKPQRLLKSITFDAQTDETAAAILQTAHDELERAFGPAVSDGQFEVSLALNAALSVSGAHALNIKGTEISIRGADAAGLLYGVFALIKAAKLEQLADGLSLESSPGTDLRMINHWDNMDGSIERGYSGQSFFFENRQLIVNERTQDYARLAASVGINAVVINNVNVKDEATWLITERHAVQVRALSELFAAYGISLYLSLNYAAPVEMGELDTADPLDPGVIAWWETQMAAFFARVPKLGGFLVKADSEGRPGPFTYGRDQACGANLLGRALKPYGAKLIWRAFVYNAQQDWRDTKTDRARAAYDYFAELDGKFEDNVYLQIKNGPMDFQVREPVSPLFSAMTQTNLILELQIAQEYTGHQIDVCYLLPQWREYLDFDTKNPAFEPSVMKDIFNLRKTTVRGPRTAIAAVSNSGNDMNWFGNDLAALNYYAYGRLTWDSAADSLAVARDWTALTFGLRGDAAADLIDLLMQSWSVYESYTAPLGIGWMVTPHTHYGPSVDGYEYDRWGTYHKADLHAIGVDRSASGTGYAGLYPAEVAAQFETVDACPDEYVLFYHRLPYTHRLKSGKTVIQHIYDSHFEGYAAAAAYVARWSAYEGLVDADVYERVRARFIRQERNAREWCDQVNSYFWRKSGIPDEQSRPLY